MDKRIEYPIFRGGGGQSLSVGAGDSAPLPSTSCAPAGPWNFKNTAVIGARLDDPKYFEYDIGYSARYSVSAAVQGLNQRWIPWDRPHAIVYSMSEKTYFLLAKDGHKPKLP
eukprot:RCo020585